MAATTDSTTTADRMRFVPTDFGPVLREIDLCAELVPLAGSDVLELGCGRAEFTLAAAERFPTARFVALEVDAAQHALNLAAPRPSNVRFGMGAAQAIPAADASFDAVLMLKSLHHVPVDAMPAALREVARVLRPGGRAYISEPVYAGDFNALVALFHDEHAERTAAFAALQRAIATGPLRLADERFWRAARRFSGFAEFRARMIDVTFGERRLSAETLAAVEERFARHVDTDGAARFDQPMRTDLLVRR